jgi:hypothetical protein
MVPQELEHDANDREGGGAAASPGASSEVPCPSCFALNPSANGFCVECGRPLGAQTALDPVQTIRTEGYLMQAAANRRPPSLIELVIHWTVMVLLVGGPLYLIHREGRRPDEGFQMVAVYWFLYGAIAVGRTWTYLRRRRRRMPA